MQATPDELVYTIIGNYSEPTNPDINEQSGVGIGIGSFEGIIGDEFSDVFPSFAETDIINALATDNFEILGDFFVGAHDNDLVIFSDFQDSGALINFSALRITLSYFVEPNPGTRSWDNGKKYKYASHLLGFTPKHAEHSMDEFQSRLNSEEENLVDSLQDHGWALGDKLRRKGGSLIQDIWKGSAAELAEMEAVAIFPRAKGWWASRKYDEDRKEHNSHLKSVPYSLIISIETEADLPVYASVSNAIQSIILGVDEGIDAET